MIIDTSNYGVVVIYMILALLVLFYAYKKGHSILYLFCQFCMSIIIFNIIVYCIFPIDLSNMIPIPYDFLEQFYYEDYTRCFTVSYWSENKNIIALFMSFSFFSACINKRMRKTFPQILVMGLIFLIQIGYHLLINKVNACVMQQVNLLDYVLIVISYVLGFIVFTGLKKFNSDTLIKLDKLKKKTENEFEEMSDLF